MSNIKIFMNDWLEIHPYNRQQDSDIYFVELANDLYNTYYFTNVPPFYHKKLCLNVAAYFEDVISKFGLWAAFIKKHKELYGKPLPFFRISNDYLEDEINEEDIRFIIWNTIIKIPGNQGYVNPLASEIKEMAKAYYQVLREEYESAPANDVLTNYLNDFSDRNEANYKLFWLFARTYLNQPSVQEFSGRVTVQDKFVIPCGPLALYLKEWMELLVPDYLCQWKTVDGLFFETPQISDDIKNRSKETYENFIEGTNGNTIKYFVSYDELKQFFVEVLKWPNNDDHTMPQLKSSRNFIMMTHPEKGVLLAKDLNEYIKDPLNAQYDEQKAKKNAFKLLITPMLCPPDLLRYILSNHFLPDAELPVNGEKEMVQNNADFIARHTLLYYYRGD
ncbi:MAG: DUF3843 family protein [Phocaeicola sp.]|uniref:DUF3843 family protein n=1 Tax=Phocaeicola TaxID=909656 RepID=UPI00234EDFA9|nr:DUF3843 family protein [Phocaeicola oris]MCE2616701.1 DUF3843 family protein [Phocaeicola oris]